MKNIFIVSFLITALFSGCQQKNVLVQEDNQISEKKTQNPECKGLFKKHMDKFSAEENDSAAYYIDKAISCNPANNNFQYCNRNKFNTAYDKQNLDALENLIKTQDRAGVLYALFSIQD